MKKAVIVVAAGSGNRMGGKIPKQYLPLQGKPIIIHTLERFLLFDPKIKIVVVLAPAHTKLWEQVAHTYELARSLETIHGGATRYDSVKNGLSLIDQEELIGIHDAVRPLVSQDTLIRCYDTAMLEGSGIPVLEMDESVRMLLDPGGSRHMDRSKLKRIQTPQVFRTDRIKDAYLQPYMPDFTDDASVYETLYGPVSLVDGNRENIKITTPQDMQLAELLIASPG
jgi:2-C-methyl-D-erythritol 4-phosphate cytidylyltransferase